MLHIVLALIAIGLALFLWERFPAFKWIVAFFFIGTVLILLVIFGVSAHKKSEKEAENQRAAEISKSNQEFVLKQKQIETPKQIDANEDPLVIFLREAEKKKKSESN